MDCPVIEALLPGHDVTTANAAGWATIANGLLIAAAERAGFGVLVTADKNIRYQQNLSGRRSGIVVLSTQNLGVLRQDWPCWSTRSPRPAVAPTRR